MMLIKGLERRVQDVLILQCSHSLQKYEPFCFYLLIILIKQLINMNIKKRNKMTWDESQDSQNLYQPTNFPSSENKRQLSLEPSQQPSLLSRPEETRTRAAKNRAKINYNDDDPKKSIQQEYEAMEEEPPAQLVCSFLVPKVEFLLWKLDHQDPEQEQFLVKFEKKSYHQATWMTRSKLLQIGFQVTSHSLKSVKNRMRKTQDLKLKQGEYFNPNFKIPDRILTSTDIFSAIHHKRANDIKGKWEETILMVGLKLVNFVKNGYPYGIILHQPYSQELEKQHSITASIHIGQIINKVYLGYYHKYSDFWVQMGRAINNFLLIYPPEKGDYHIIGETIKQCAIFVYAQWHRLSKERYDQLAKELSKDNIIPQKMQNESELAQTLSSKQHGPEEIESKENEKNKEQQGQKVEPEINLKIVHEYCKSNIFLDEKSVDRPKNSQQFQILNPGLLSFSWLDQSEPEKYKAWVFKCLKTEDLSQLDLNHETDRLYYIKWKDMSYRDATWQSQKVFNCPEKIEEFKTLNKIPVKEIRGRFQAHHKIHKFLLEYNQFISDRKNTNNQNINKMETKMYRLDVAKDREPRQYGEKDIPIYKNYRKLKDFQLESLNWLIKSWYENKNTILADEMGLGKTIQTIAFLFHLYSYESVIGPFLILAPLTTLQQWRRQIEEWTNFNCLLYYDEGKYDIREIIQEYQFFHLHTTKTGDIITSKLPKFQILLTNYELFINDFQILKLIPYQHIVLDEAHRLKNKNTKTAITLNKLPCVRKTLLTGTPIQNNTKELWTLLNFIEPKTFNSEEKFLAEYGSLSTEDQVKNFKKMLKPYLLRRVKEDVESTIPRLSENIIDVEMSSRQKAYYKGILEKNKTSMLKGLTTANFNSISIQLRKCCNHPYLVSPEVETEIKYGATTIEQESQRFIMASGKTILLIKLLQKFKKEGKKVLIFSQFVVMLELLKPYLEIRGYNCQILTGSQSSTTRTQAISRFNDHQTDVFLISTKAGGVGINLVAATEIIIFDSDWNPQNDIQATARAHRIGQKKQVNVYRLIISNSYESEMFQMSSKKLGLDKAIFAGDTFKSMGEFDEAEKQLTKDEIEMLLKKGVIGFLDNQMNEEDYFNQSIEDILSNNARQVVYSVTPNCSVSKTKFKSEENNIQLDAPDFWEQAMKCFQTPLDKLVKKRGQLKEYSNLQKQQELLLETYKIVLDFVKQKTLGTGFNAEDERKLLKFLEAINSERHINRHLRDIADQLAMEIQKPSRRFKVKEEDIIGVEGATTKEPEKIKNTRLRSSKMELQTLGLAAEAEEEDQYSGVEEEEESPSDSPQKESTPQNKEEDVKSDDNYEKLCFLCQKPKPTVFCKGVCGRVFHKKCFEAFNSQGVTPESDELDELHMQLESWRQNRVYESKCVDCKEKKYKFKCWVCQKVGNFIEEETSKSRKGKIKKQIMTEDQNTVFKCNVQGKCNRFYHLDCLFIKQFEGKFSDHTGKIIKDISSRVKVFRCPSHYCLGCYGSDPKSTKLKSFTCVRCCKTFHEKCLNKEEFIKLGSSHYYICSIHLKSPAQAEKMALQILKFKPSKKDKMIQKKRDKHAKHKAKETKERSEIKQTKGLAQNEANKIKPEEKSELQSSYKEDDSKLRRSKRKKNSEPFPELDPELKEQKKKSKNKEKKQKKADRSSEELKVESSSHIEKEVVNASKQLHGSSGQKDKKSKKDKDQASHLNTSKKSLKQLETTFEFKYKDFGLIPIYEFDYSSYKHPWCRYCGSRYALGFQAGPWEGSSLCEHHCQQWKKDRLHLDKYKSEPKKPINKNKENQLKFLNEYCKKNQITAIDTLKNLNEKLGIAE